MAQPLTDAINALTRYANETTGASDTTLSDAVRTLCDGYGGGGGGLFTLLEETTLAEEQRAFDIDTTQYAQEYDVLIVTGDVTVPANDWIYVTQNGTSGGSYTGSVNEYTGLFAVWIRGFQTHNVIAKASANTGISIADTLSNIYIYCYVASKAFGIGSKVKVYGAKFADIC